MKGSSIWKWSC